MKAEEAYFAYSSVLDAMIHDPGLAADRNGYIWLRKAMPGVTPGERTLAFPLPDGWPAHDLTACAVFSMEMVRALVLHTSVCSNFAHDEVSYKVTTPWGEVGISEGRVIGADDSLGDYSGFISGMLESPRGRLSTECHYDLLSRLRSALYEDPGRFAEWQGTDNALQALRVLCEGLPLLDLQAAISGMSMQAAKRRLRATAFQEALTIMESWSFTDRTKISMLLELLVPNFMNMRDFARKIQDPNKVLPAVLPTKSEVRILANLRNELRKANDSIKAYEPQRSSGD
jgi:hypothetical protein